MIIPAWLPQFTALTQRFFHPGKQFDKTSAGLVPVRGTGLQAAKLFGGGGELDHAVGGLLQPGQQFNDLVTIGAEFGTGWRETGCRGEQVQAQAEMFVERYELRSAWQFVDRIPVIVECPTDRLEALNKIAAENGVEGATEREPAPLRRSCQCQLWPTRK